MPQEITESTVKEMPLNSFLPSRDAVVYIEHHSAAGGLTLWTVWLDGSYPIALNLDNPAEAAREYEQAVAKWSTRS